MCVLGGARAECMAEGRAGPESEAREGGEGSREVHRAATTPSSAVALEAVSAAAVAASEVHHVLPEGTGGIEAPASECTGEAEKCTASAGLPPSGTVAHLVPSSFAAAHATCLPSLVSHSMWCWCWHAVLWV